MKAKHLIYMMALSLAATTAITSCSSDDDPKVLTAAVMPSEISMQLPDNVQKLLYTDATGATCLPLITGESVNIAYTMAPDNTTYKEVIWTSSNPAIASVSTEGVVTALSGSGAGYSIVEVAPLGVFSGSGINSNVKVVVSDQLVPATSIAVSSTADELYAGDTLHLTATIAPDGSTYKTVEWSSSNEAIASVDASGIVTAQVSDATTASVTITATALDGSGVKASKDLTVKQIVQPQSITIDDSFNGYNYALNEKSVQLTYTTLPAECTESLIQWTSSDESVATVDAGKVTFKSFGTVTITATAPETGNSSSVTLNIPAGLLRETFHNPDHYIFYNAAQSGNGTASSHVWHDGYITITTYTQNATNQRGDIRCWETPVTLHAGNYPILAVRMTDPKDIEGISSRNINFDVVGTSESGTEYKALGNGNNKWTTDYKLSDGSHVFMYDLTQVNFSGNVKITTTESVSFRTFQIKVADIRTATSQLQYNLYWVQTFKSLEDMENYIKNVDGLTY